MDVLLLIFALQLAVLLLCLTFSVESSKLQSALSLQNIKSLLAKVIGRKPAIELDTFEIDPPKFDNSVQTSNDDNVVYLDSKRSHDILAEFSDEDELDTLEANAVKSNFNELSADNHSRFLFSWTAILINKASRLLRSFVLKFRKPRNSQHKLRWLASSQVSSGVSAAPLKTPSGYRSVTHIASLSSQVMSSRVRSGHLRYKNKELSETALAHLKTKLTKLNFVIYKKKKTRPLPVVYELPEEMF
jgi:hypothetical protein